MDYQFVENTHFFNPIGQAPYQQPGAPSGLAAQHLGYAEPAMGMADPGQHFHQSPRTAISSIKHEPEHQDLFESPRAVHVWGQEDVEYSLVQSSQDPTRQEAAPPAKKRKAADEGEEDDLDSEHPSEIPLMRVEAAVEQIAARNQSLRKNPDGTFLVLDGTRFEKDFEALRVTRTKKNENAKHRPFASMSRHYKLLKGEKWAGTSSLFAHKSWRPKASHACSTGTSGPASNGSSSPTAASPDDGMDRAGSRSDSSEASPLDVEPFAFKEAPPDSKDSWTPPATAPPPPMPPAANSGMVSADRVQVHLKDDSGTVIDCTLQQFLSVTGAGELFRRATAAQNENNHHNSTMASLFGFDPEMALVHEQVPQVVGGLWNADSRGDQAYFFKRMPGVEPFPNGCIVGVSDGLLVTDDLVDKDSGLFMVVSDNNVKWKGEPIPSEEEELLGHWCAFLGQVPVIVDGPVKCGQAIGPKFDGSGHAQVTRLGESPVVGLALADKPANRPGVVKTLVFAGLNAMTGNQTTNDQYDHLLQQSLKAEMVVLQHDVAIIESDINNMQGRMDEQMGQIIQFQDRVQHLEKTRQFDSSNTSASTVDSAAALPPQTATPDAVQIAVPVSNSAISLGQVKEGWSAKTPFRIVVAIALCLMMVGLGIGLGYLVCSSTHDNDSVLADSTPIPTPSPEPTATPPPCPQLAPSRLGNFKCPNIPFRSLSDNCKDQLGPTCDARCIFCNEHYQGPNAMHCRTHIAEENICDYEELFYQQFDTPSTSPGADGTEPDYDYTNGYFSSGSEVLECESSPWENQNYPDNPCMEEIGYAVEQGIWPNPASTCPLFAGPPGFKCPSLPWREITPAECGSTFVCDPECVFCGQPLGGPTNWTCPHESHEDNPCQDEAEWVLTVFVYSGHMVCNFKQDEEGWPCQQEFEQSPGGLVVWGLREEEGNQGSEVEDDLQRRGAAVRQAKARWTGSSSQE